jgi:LPXTG-motif cell wall-anchored protein
VKTDEQTTPGFSQARGTITGHISFGSGTAVRNAGPVKTGDTTNIILPVVLLGASAAAIGFALVKRKKI